jgi:hypothetical protein
MKSTSLSIAGMMKVKAVLLAALVSGCQQTTQQIGEPGTATAATHAELMAEARAFGTAQGVAGVGAAFDPTGAASVPLMVSGRAAHQAWITTARARMEAAEAADRQEFYKKYGMNPDGTPSGRPGPGSSVPQGELSE